MLTPPEETYDTYENLYGSVSAFTRTQVYAVTVARSTGGRKYWLKCDRGGPPRRVLEEKRKRKVATKTCYCKFQLYARIQKDGLLYLTVKYGEHNHSPTLDIAGHPAERRLNKKQKLMVELNIKAGMSPIETLTALRLGTGDTNERKVDIK